MGNKKNHKKVAAIVPAYNEERDIAGVLREMSSYEGFEEVIVVDDGSTDATANIAQLFPVRLIRHKKNRGKGAALQSGVAATSADIFFFCDADMRGLSHQTLEDVLQPVITGKTDMVIAMRNWRMYWTGFFFSVIPILGGQRALTRELWLKVPHKYREGFMVETALNFYARYWGRGYQYKVMQNLRQTIKERKYGFWRGIIARSRMYTQVLEAHVRLQFFEIPSSVRSGRIALTNVLWSIGNATLGVILLFAAYSGPVAFVRDVFARGLLNDPDTPFVHLLLRLASSVAWDVIAYLGIAIIVLNVLVTLFNLKNLRLLIETLPPVRRIR